MTQPVKTDNSATIKIIANMTREYNKLSDKYKTLMEVHEKTLRNEYNLTDKLKEQRREFVEDLKKAMSNKIMPRWEIEQLIEKWEGKK